MTQRRRRNRARMHRRLILVLGSSAATLALLAGVEGLLALLDVAPPRPVTPVRFAGAIDPEMNMANWDRELLFKLPPDSDFLGYYRTNGSGYRGRELGPRREPGVFRILCLGDSCTFGLGVREDETFAAELQRLLDVAYDGRLRFEVANLGVTGYTSFQSRRQIERELPRLEPDLVVFLPTGLNDAGLAAGPSDRELARRQDSLGFRLGSTRLARCLGLGALDHVIPAEGFAARNPGGAPRVPVGEFAENLSDVADLCRAHGADLLLVAYELADRAHARDPSLRARQAEFDRFAKERGVALADPRPALRNLKPSPMQQDGMHPTPAGHRILAGAVFRELVRSDRFLPPDGRRAFWRAFLRVREHGVAGHGAPDPGLRADPPPSFAEILAAAMAPDLDRRLASGDPSLPDAVRRFDPVLGRERGAYVAGALVLRLLSGEVGGGEAKALRARVQEIEREARPRDPFLRLLFGGGKATAPAAEQAALARALAVLDRLLDIEPAPADRRLGRAIDAAAVNDWRGAVSWLEQVLALWPDCPEALERMVLAAFRAGQPQRAGDALERLRLLGEDQPGYQMTAGLLAVHRRRFDEAVALLEPALERRPVSIEGHFGLGCALLARGDLDRARRELTIAAAINGQVPADVESLLSEIEQRGRER